MVKAAGLELFRGFDGSRGWRFMAGKSQGGSGVVEHPCEAKSSHSLHIHPLLLHFHLYSSIRIAASPSLTSGICHPLWKPKIRLSWGAEGISREAWMENRRSSFPAWAQATESFPNDLGQTQRKIIPTWHAQLTLKAFPNKELIVKTEIKMNARNGKYK